MKKVYGDFDFFWKKRKETFSHESLKEKKIMTQATYILVEATFLLVCF
jgi:hypothetical protein